MTVYLLYEVHMDTQELELSDGVWARVVQVIQEGILFGQDVVDILRLVRVRPDETNPNVLVLSPAYEARVKEMHVKLVEEAKRLKEKDTIVVDPGIVHIKN
jgi:hypothetical protein